MAGEIRKMVKLSEVHFDEEMYPRTHYSWQTAYDYSQSLKCGAKMPPIVLAEYEKKLYLVDGKHRLEAVKLLKGDKIQAEIHKGWTKEKIFTEAIKRNIAHGRVLSPYEKRKVALQLREMKIAEGEISKLIQIPEDKLENFVGGRLVNTLTGKEVSGDESAELARQIGQSILKSGIKHLAGQTLDENVLDNQEEFYAGSQVSLLNHLITIIEEGMLDVSNKEVVAKIATLKELLKSY